MPRVSFLADRLEGAETVLDLGISDQVHLLDDVAPDGGD